MSGQFLIVPFKPNTKFGQQDKESLKSKALDELKRAFNADQGQHIFKVIVVRCKAEDYLEAGSQLPRVTQAALEAKEKIGSSCEVSDWTIQPELGIVSSQMNIPESKPGK